MAAWLGVKYLSVLYVVVLWAWSSSSPRGCLIWLVLFIAPEMLRTSRLMSVSLR